MPERKRKSLNELFAANLKALRTAKSMTQEALAKAAGVSVSYVSMLERGQRSPPFDTLEQIAKALNTKPVALLGEH